MKQNKRGHQGQILIEWVIAVFLLSVILALILMAPRLTRKSDALFEGIYEERRFQILKD